MKLWEQHLGYTIQERKMTTQLRISRDAKIKRDIGARSVRMSKEKGDTLFKRMMYHLEMYKKFKRQVIQKYSGRVRQHARS